MGCLDQKKCRTVPSILGLRELGFYFIFFQKKQAGLNIHGTDGMGYHKNEDQKSLGETMDRI